MNDLEMFVSLPRATQRRILDLAREVARATSNRIEYYSTVSAITVTEWEKFKAHRDRRLVEMDTRRDGWQHRRTN